MFVLAKYECTSKSKVYKPQGSICQPACGTPKPGMNNDYCSKAFLPNIFSCGYYIPTYILTSKRIKHLHNYATVMYVIFFIPLSVNNLCDDIWRYKICFLFIFGNQLVAPISSLIVFRKTDCGMFLSRFDVD